jgi:hypothetical protein
MPNSGYIAPPKEPPGGWKNQAQWIGNVEYWSEEMFKLGYSLDDLKKIYQSDIGEPFPRNLENSIKAKNWLFPGADMLQEYDLQHHQKRSYPHKNAEYPEGTGYGEWTPMDPSEIAAANQYTDWRNNPGHEWMLGATAADPEGNPYQAWLAQWGDKFKDPGWKPSPNASSRMVATDIHTGKPLTTGGNPPPPTTTPIAPVTPTPTPAGPNNPIDPLSSNTTSKYFGVAPTSSSSVVGFGLGNSTPKVVNNGPTTPNSMLGWGDVSGINNKIRRRGGVMNTGITPWSPYNK